LTIPWSTSGYWPAENRVKASGAMHELLRTNDVVRLSFLRAVLEDAGIPTIVLDQHMSVLEGSAGAIPRRLMVADEDERAARALVMAAEADLGREA
jgi:hypothetical protein